MHVESRLRGDLPLDPATVECACLIVSTTLQVLHLRTHLSTAEIRNGMLQEALAYSCVTCSTTVRCRRGYSRLAMSAT